MVLAEPIREKDGELSDNDDISVKSKEEDNALENEGTVEEDPDESSDIDTDAICEANSNKHLTQRFNARDRSSAYDSRDRSSESFFSDLSDEQQVGLRRYQLTVLMEQEFFMKQQLLEYRHLIQCYEALKNKNDGIRNASTKQQKDIKDLQSKLICLRNQYVFQEYTIEKNIELKDEVNNLKHKLEEIRNRTKSHADSVRKLIPEIDSLRKSAGSDNRFNASNATRSVPSKCCFTDVLGGIQEKKSLDSASLQVHTNNSKKVHENSETAVPQRNQPLALLTKVLSNRCLGIEPNSEERYSTPGENKEAETGCCENLSVLIDLKVKIAESKAQQEIFALKAHKSKTNLQNLLKENQILKRNIKSNKSSHASEMEGSFYRETNSIKSQLSALCSNTSIQELDEEHPPERNSQTLNLIKPKNTIPSSKNDDTYLDKEDEIKGLESQLASYKSQSEFHANELQKTLQACNALRNENALLQENLNS